MAIVLISAPGDARRAPAISATASEPVQPTWIEIARPDHIFALKSPEFEHSDEVYEARRHAAGGGRQEILSFGGFRGPGPYLRVTLYRVGREKAATMPFFVDIARRAGEAELSVVHSDQPGAIETRLGPVEVAEVRIADAKGEAPCLGFRFAKQAPDLRVSGFACGALRGGLERDALACIMEGLELVSGVDDRPLAEFFVAADSSHSSRRRQCRKW